MKTSITEEMRFHQRLCEYAKKNGVTRAARRYHTNRQFVYRQLDKYNGDVKSLALRSRRPHSSPNAHTEKELDLSKKDAQKEWRLRACRSICEMFVERLQQVL